MSELLDEQPFSLSVNGRPYATVMMLSSFLKEFAVGYLLSENIAKPEEIESVMIEENTISVLTKNPLKVLAPKKTVISGCGGTASYLDPEKLPKAAFVSHTFQTMADFDSPVTKAGGFGSALLTEAGDAAKVFDLSQMTALDKLFGIAVSKNILLSESVVCVSGKITADMVRKCLFAGVSELHANLPPTKLAFEIAKESGLKIVY
ncbi:MAG TPA: formate dehydrogenase accessory sulfurtransferase FdhD [Methanocorpusculum sp.]|nr:formate dehydrogenase accessory sulfurtransferase FdhD [Methanocorpusculum sp.]